MRVAQLLSLPNLLSLLRFPLAVAFVIVDDARVRTGIVIAAAITDLLDGWLARHVWRPTTVGALLDPIADKTFVLAALAAFLVDGALMTWEYLVILLRDLGTAVGFVVAWRLPGLDPARFKARWPGKVVTVLQLVILLALLVRPHAVVWLVPVIGVISVYALVDYTLMLHRTRVRA